MTEERDHTADPEQPVEGGFAEGQADPAAHPEDEHVGRFSEGQEQLGEEDAEKHHKGRFSEGQELLGEEDPEKHIQGSFGRTRSNVALIAFRANGRLATEHVSSGPAKRWRTVPSARTLSPSGVICQTGSR